MDVSNLDIQHIDEDEASEDLSVVERQLNEDYQPKSVRIHEAGKKVRGKDLDWVPKSIAHELGRKSMVTFILSIFTQVSEWLMVLRL